jgi:hypothetical protein
VSWYTDDNFVFERDFRDLIVDKGWWTVLRSMDLTKRSKYWNGSEAIGGPAWEYRDILTKCRRVETTGVGSAFEHQNRQQFTDVYGVSFYMASRVRPKKEDIIIELPDNIKAMVTPPKVVRAFELFTIHHVEGKYESGGLIYSKIYCEKKTPVNDETLKGPIPVRYIKIK